DRSSCHMCHPAGFLELGYIYPRPVQAGPPIQESTMAPAARGSPTTRGGPGGGGGEHICVCSPTRHPGSFRCRHHRGGYVWRRGSGSQKEE
ncbi:hypothetical protein Dimus_026478, partial [Dionaea muscipula]